MEIVRPMLMVLAAAILAYSLYLFINWLSERILSASRVSRLLGGALQEKETVRFGSEKYRLRLAFSCLGLNTAGWEIPALWLARLAGAGLVFLAVFLAIGLPFLPAALVGLAGILLVNGLITGAWSKARADLESEIPGFLSSFTSTIQVTQDVLLAMEEEMSVLQPGGPLRAWLAEFLQDARQHGPGILAEKQKEAAGLSSPLAAMLFLIEGLWRSGGPEWKNSFALASQNLENVLDARITANAVGESAKGNIKIVAAITLGVMVMMIRNPAFGEALANPFIQLGYAVFFGAMMFGWNLMNKMIDESV